MNLNPAEISELIKSRIEGLGASADIKNQGTVVSVADGICRVHGLSDAMAGEMLEFPGNTFGLAMNLERDSVGAVVLLNATLCMTLYVRAIDRYGAAAVAMLFAVIPAIAGVLSWVLLGQRPDLGVVVGLVLGALACWLNSRAVARTVRSAAPAPATPPLRTAESSRSGPSDRRDQAAECPCP